jgi:hypothetical protein
MDKGRETSPKRESSSNDLTKQLFRGSEKASVSGSKDTTTGPERKPTEQKKEMDSRLRLSNGLEITQPLAKRILEMGREQKMPPASESKDTTTGPERKPTEQKKEMDSRLRLSNGLEIRQPLAKRFLEKQRELQNEKMSPAPENKDTTTGPENTFTRSQSENYLPKYKLTRMHMERARRLQNEIQPKQEDKIEK